MNRCRIIIVLFLLAASKLFIFGRDDGVNISGWVTDAVSGDFLIGSNILLYKDSLSINSQPLKGAATNNLGFYVIPKIPKGKYVIVVRNIGYKTHVSEINNTISDGSMRYNIKLKPEDVELEEIVVEDKKLAEDQISTIDIPAELLQQLPSMSGEVPIFKSLELMPGVKTSSELSNGLYVRGGSPDQTLTLLDGVIVYNPSHLGNFSSTFNSNALQNIKLIKGAFPAEYGGRLSSVLDIKLRSGTQEKDKRVLTLGTISSNITLEGPLSKNLTYMLSGRSMYYDVFQKSFNKDGTSPRYNFYDFSGKFTFNISENNILSISGLYSEDNLYNPDNSPDVEYDIGWKNSTISFNWLQINSSSLLVNTIVSFINYEFSSNLNTTSQSAISSNFFSKSRLNDFIIRTNVESNLIESNRIKAGVELTLHDYNLLYTDFYSEQLENNSDLSTDILATEISLFLQDEIEITPFWKSNIGGRMFYFISKEFIKFEPRISTSFYFTDNIQLNLAYSMAHQFLHLIVRNDISLPTDLWYPSKDKVEPSQSKQYVIGIDTYWFDKVYKFSLEAYYKQMKNLYEFKNAPTIQFRENIESQFTMGEGEAYGLEVFLNKRAGKFTGWIGYTLSWTKRKFDELNAGRLFYPRYDRRHDVSIVLSYLITNSFSVGLTWTYATGQGFTIPTGQYVFGGDVLNPNELVQYSYTERNGFKLPDYHKLDFNAAYKFSLFGIPAETYLNLFNVYNRSNPFAVYINLEENENAEVNVPKIKELTLFPFIPTVGLKIKF